MKKIIKLSLSLILILTITLCMNSNVYAALSCNMNLGTSKTEVSPNDEFIVNVNISNIKSNNGVISLGAILEYDKDSLTLVKMEGKNGWDTPIEGASYNSANGKMAITRGGLGKNDETVFSITFKVRETNAQSAKISLKDVNISDGTLAEIGTIEKNIKIVKKGDSNQDSDNNQNPGTPEKPGDSNQGSNNNQNPGTTQKPGGSNQGSNNSQNSSTYLKQENQIQW